MEAKELHEILKLEEGLKLDFKREYNLKKSPPTGTDRQKWTNFVNGQWDEFIKDIIALTNGNVGTADEVALLIIGADDTLLPDGSRQLFDMSKLQLTAQQIMAKVNSACKPPIPNIFCETVQIDGKTLYVISVPPTPHLHETSRQLIVTKGNFDSTGRLVSVVQDKVYTEFTAFIRKGEDIHSASNDERRALEIDKKSDLLVMNENIKFELINNLKSLLAKGKNGIYDPSLFYQSFKENHKIEPDKDLVLERKYVVRLHIVIINAISAKSNLSTQFVNQAIMSGRYLVYNISERRYERSQLLESLHKLQTNIRSFLHVAESPQITGFLAKYDGRGQRNELIRVEHHDILFVAAMLDRYEDIITISKALLRYFLGDKKSLENLELNDVSPIATEAEKIKEEIPSEMEIIEWILK